MFDGHLGTGAAMLITKIAVDNKINNNIFSQIINKLFDFHAFYKQTLDS